MTVFRCVVSRAVRTLEVSQSFTDHVYVRLGASLSERRVRTKSALMRVISWQLRVETYSGPKHILTNGTIIRRRRRSNLSA
jgi:hypothetical protein